MIIDREITHVLIYVFPYQVSAADIKKVKMSVESLYSEKLKMEKNAKKPAPKNKGKVSLRTENDVRSRLKPVNICFIFYISLSFRILTVIRSMEMILPRITMILCEEHI